MRRCCSSPSGSHYSTPDPAFERARGKEHLAPLDLIVGQSLMRAELIVAAGVFFVWLGVSSANPMFPRFNRPSIFRGTWGEPFFGLVTLSILAGAISLLVWSFANITWYVNLLVLVGALVISENLVRVLPAFFVGSALAPVVAATGLVILHNLAWFSLR